MARVNSIESLSRQSTGALAPMANGLKPRHAERTCRPMDSPQHGRRARRLDLRTPWLSQASRRDHRRSRDLGGDRRWRAAGACQPPPGRVLDHSPGAEIGQQPDRDPGATVRPSRGPPGVTGRQSAISVPGARGFMVDPAAGGPLDAFLVPSVGEFAHLHPGYDGSLHLALPPALARDAGQGLGGCPSLGRRPPRTRHGDGLHPPRRDRAGHRHRHCSHELRLRDHNLIPE